MAENKLQRLQDLMEKHASLPFPPMPSADSELDRWEDLVEVDAEVAGMVTTALAGGSFDSRRIQTLSTALAQQDNLQESQSISTYRSSLRGLMKGLDDL